MSRGVNKVILIGNLGRDPELKSMPNGNPVAQVALATSESWKDKQTGQAQERTEWHRVIFFGKLAEIVGEFLKKGSKVYVEGKLRTRKWQAQDGGDRYSTEVIVDIEGRMQMLDSRNVAGAGQHAAQPQQGYQNQQNPTYTPAAQQPQQGGQGFDNFDDDIPF